MGRTWMVLKPVIYLFAERLLKFWGSYTWSERLLRSSPVIFQISRKVPHYAVLKYICITSTPTLTLSISSWKTVWAQLNNSPMLCIHSYQHLWYLVRHWFWLLVGVWVVGYDGKIGFLRFTPIRYWNLYYKGSWSWADLTNLPWVPKDQYWGSTFAAHPSRSYRETRQKLMSWQTWFLIITRRYPRILPSPTECQSLNIKNYKIYRTQQDRRALFMVPSPWNWLNATTAVIYVNGLCFLTHKYLSRSWDRGRIKAYTRRFLGFWYTESMALHVVKQLEISGKKNSYSEWFILYIQNRGPLHQNVEYLDNHRNVCGGQDGLLDESYLKLESGEYGVCGTAHAASHHSHYFCLDPGRVRAIRRRARFHIGTLTVFIYNPWYSVRSFTADHCNMGTGQSKAKFLANPEQFATRVGQLHACTQIKEYDFVIVGGGELWIVKW